MCTYVEWAPASNTLCCLLMRPTLHDSTLPTRYISACLSVQVVAGTNYAVVFRVDDPCSPVVPINEPPPVLDALVFEPLPYTNDPMMEQTVQRVG